LQSGRFFFLLVSFILFVDKLWMGFAKLGDLFHLNKSFSCYVENSNKNNGCGISLLLKNGQLVFEKTETKLRIGIFLLHNQI
jgi:hypothetical protein